MDLFENCMNEQVSILISNIAELKTCSNNAFVNAQIVGLKATRNLINNLPDGYPIPMERR